MSARPSRDRSTRPTENDTGSGHREELRIMARLATAAIVLAVVPAAGEAAESVAGKIDRDIGNGRTT